MTGLAFGAEEVVCGADLTVILDTRFSLDTMPHWFFLFIRFFQNLQHVPLSLITFFAPFGKFIKFDTSGRNFGWILRHAKSVNSIIGHQIKFRLITFYTSRIGDF